MLRSLVASKSPADLKQWVLCRLRGEDSMPMVYQGKEVEHPHEAVAVLFGLSNEVLTLEKRRAIVAGLKEIRRFVSDACVDGTLTLQQVEQARNWAEVVELAKPEELRNDARLFLDAFMLVPNSAALPALAAAATAFVESGSYGGLFWNKLLENRNTAALAFRRLLDIEPFEQAAQHWVKLLEKQVKEAWPTNVRMLVAALLNKAPFASNPELILAELIGRAGLNKEAERELKPSKNEKVIQLLKEIKYSRFKWTQITSEDDENFILTVMNLDIENRIELVDSKAEQQQSNLYSNLAPLFASNSEPVFGSSEERKEYLSLGRYSNTDKIVLNSRNSSNSEDGWGFSNIIYEASSRARPWEGLIQIHKSKFEKLLAD